MNENIVLTKILKNCPVGTEFYHAAYGRVWFICIDLDSSYPIRLSFSKELSDDVSVTSEGFINKNHNGECLLFPSKDQRDWSKFTAPWLNKESEHKFHEGDWVVYNNDICQIVKREEGCNKLVTVFGIEKELVNERNLSTARLWTIQDAKDGDVLSFYSEYKGNKMVQVGIIEKYVGKHGGCSNTFKIYVGVNWDNNLQIGEYMGCSDIHPATKEQRDLLFQKIKEAGYKWNVETKTLEKLVKHKFNPKTLQPFDKVLAKIGTERYYTWFPDFVSFPPNDINDKIACIGKDVVFMAIPYNDETKHLIDTNDEAPEFYRYWED